MNILTIILIVFAALLGFYYGQRKNGTIFVEREFKKENKLQILEILDKKENITNDDVQKLLGVSDATATRYLSELEKEGKIKQVGKTGAGVYYVLNR